MKCVLDPATLKELRVQIPKYSGKIPKAVLNRSKKIKNCLYVKCVRCGLIFEELGSFSVHNLEKHGIIVEEKIRTTTENQTPESQINSVEKMNLPEKINKKHRSHVPKYTKRKGKVKPNLTCTFCGKRMNSEASRKVHERTQHNTSPHTCKYCGKVFKIRLNGITHEQRMHRALETPLKPFQCQTCQIGFNKEFNFEQHMKRHKNGEIEEKNSKQSCSECGNVYKSLKDLKRHFRRMHQLNQSYSCQYCNKFFPRKSDGLVHERKVHRMLVEQEKPFKCKHCIRGFDTEKFLKLHEANHENDQLKCRICDKEFFYLSQRTTHELACHTDEIQELTAPHSFECHFCGKKFSRKGALLPHFATHFSLKAFCCEICGKSFKRNEALKRHIENIHQGKRETPVNCQACNRLFLSISSLRYHFKKAHHPVAKPKSKELVDTKNTQKQIKEKDDKMYECKECRMLFTTYSKLKTHVRNHGRSFTCSWCGKQLVSASNLKEHEKLHGDKMYHCDLCDASFAQKTGILHHKRDTHATEKKYNCDMCEKSFKHSTEYHIHKKEHKDPSLKRCEICQKDYASRPSYFIHRRNAHPELLKKGSNKVKKDVNEPKADSQPEIIIEQPEVAQTIEQKNFPT